MNNLPPCKGYNSYVTGYTEDKKNCGRVVTNYCIDCDTHFCDKCYYSHKGTAETCKCTCREHNDTLAQPCSLCKLCNRSICAACWPRHCKLASTHTGKCEGFVVISGDDVKWIKCDNRGFIMCPYCPVFAKVCLSCAHFHTPECPTKKMRMEQKNQ